MSPSVMLAIFCIAGKCSTHLHLKPESGNVGFQNESLMMYLLWFYMELLHIKISVPYEIRSTLKHIWFQKKPDN